MCIPVAFLLGGILWAAAVAGADSVRHFAAEPLGQSGGRTLESIFFSGRTTFPEEKLQIRGEQNLKSPLNHPHSKNVSFVNVVE